MGEQINKPGEEQADATDQNKNGFVQQVYPLRNADGGDTDNGRDGGSNQRRDENVRRLRSAHLRAVHHDADGYQYQPGRVHYQKHNHRVGSGIFFRIQLLKLFHGFQSHRGGGIVQPQHVGGKVHEDGTHGGVSFGNFREEAAEHGTQPARKRVYHTAVFADFHDAQP